MPEGFSSVADFKVVVDANAEKFHSGLQGVRGALSSLKTEGDSNLGGLDNAFQLVGNTVVGFRGKFALAAAAVEAGIGIYKQFASEGRAVAESFGVTAEFDRLTATIDDLGMTIQDGAVQSFFALQSAATATSGEMFGFASATGVASDGSGNFAATLLTKVADALDLVRVKLRILNADLATNSGELDKTVSLIDARIATLRERLEKISSGVEAGTTTTYNRAGKSVIDQAAVALDEINTLEEKRNEIIAKRSALPGQDWADGTQTFNSLLGDQVSRLEDQRNALGLGSAAAAAYAAEQDAINKAIAQGIPLTADRLAQIRSEAQQIGALTAAIESVKKAETDRRADEQRAQQTDRAQQNAFNGADREMTNLRVRAQALDLTAAAAARLAFEERLLQQLRASGGSVSDADVVKVRALGEEYERLTEELRLSQNELQAFNQTGQAISQGLGNAFSQWTRGAELNVQTMVANMIAQLAQLAFQASVLEPLFGGGTTQGGGAVGSLLSSAFGGFREGGGPVEAGKAYVVGERRAELFIPNTSGRIEPSTGSGGTAFHNVTNIDARGAGPNEVQELKRMMAERDAALPNQVLSVVREGRERGVA